MRLKSRLADWQKNDLISAGQVRDIILFEKSRGKDLFQTRLKYVALFAILLGVSLVVAANWDWFPVSIRLGVHVLLNMGVAGSIWLWTDNPARRPYREGAVYVLSGLTLTLLALIGQSFHLQGDIGALLILWLGLITGMIIVAGDHERVVRFWLLGFTVTFFVGGAHILSLLDRPYDKYLIVTVAVLLPLALWWCRHIRGLRGMNEPFVIMLRQASFIAAGIAGFAASFIYYIGAIEFLGHTTKTLNEMYGFLAILAVIGATFFVGTWQLLRKNDDLFILVLCAISVFVPFLLPLESSIVAAIHFVVLSLLLGFAAMRGGYHKLMNLCLTLVSIRLFSVFLGLFGMMLMTGWGMIIAGLLLFVILRVMRGLQRYMVKGNTDGGRNHA